MPQLFFLKRDLTGPMGLLRHFPSDLVNNVIDELTKYELIRQGRKQKVFFIYSGSFSNIIREFLINKNKSINF